MFFNKEKDFVLKLVNIVLILWLVGAISALQFSLTELFFKDPKLTLSEYEIYYCNNYREYLEEIYSSDEDDCVKQYKIYEKEHKTFDNDKIKYVVMALGNVIIVSASLYFVNKERKKI